MSTVAKVCATEAALELIDELRRRYGDLMFHQSGGCCDGSSPMCYPRGEFIVGDRDVLLGQIGGQPFYSGAAQYETWKHTQLIIDVVAGRGGMFSLAISPLVATNTRNKVDVFVNVSGGGPFGQAGATVMGVARALIKMDAGNGAALRAGGFLTRDARIKERKKYGLRGARRGCQYSKR